VYYAGVNHSYLSDGYKNSGINYQVCGVNIGIMMLKM
jgi:hypothetical protein